MWDGTFKITTATIISLLVLLGAYFVKVNAQQDDKIANRLPIRDMVAHEEKNKEEYHELLEIVRENTREQIAQGKDIRGIMTELKIMNERRVD